MPQTDIRLQGLTADHVAGAVALSQAARWPHRRQDWDVLLGLSEGSVAIDAAGQVVGTAIFTPFGITGGALSMIIVAESLRGRGIGRRLFRMALEAGAGRRLRLTATPDGAPLYRSLGFEPFGRVFQHQGILSATPAPGGAEDAVAGDEAAIGRLDEAAFGENRRALLQSLWRVGRFAVCRQNGAVEGYGCVRPFGRGSLIGPVVAASSRVAEALIAHLASGLKGEFVRLDITAESGLEGALEAFGLPKVDDGLVMWTAPPDLPAPTVPRTMALASQALG